jgi:hypothetical protein
MSVHYTFRRSVLEQDRTYSLQPDRIVSEGDGLPPQSYLFTEVRKVHLKYEHTKQREYYQCFIHTTRGRIALRHLHYVGFAKFEDRRATYVPFVKALLAALANVPGVQFRGGSMANFIGAVIGTPVMAGLAWLCFSLGRLGLALVAAAMGGLALMMIAPSRPRRFEPLAPPEDLLPELRNDNLTLS